MRIKKRKDQHIVIIKENGNTYVMFEGTKQECKEFCKTYGKCLMILESM